jgi:hypothetical protein
VDLGQALPVMPRQLGNPEVGRGLPPVIRVNLFKLVLQDAIDPFRFFVQAAEPSECVHPKWCGRWSRRPVPQRRLSLVYSRPDTTNCAALLAFPPMVTISG